MLRDEEIIAISEETGFSAAQVERLYNRFKSLDKSGICGSLSRQDFLRVPELAINPLCDQIVHMFFEGCDEEHDRINFRQFMKVLATFRSTQKTSPLTRSRNCSRQESLSSQQSILKQTPLLFDTIDPAPFSSALVRRHSRHSSYHEGFHDAHHFYQHRTTNQHSVHYAASTNHLPLSANGFYPFFQTGAWKKQLPIIDPSEPPNSKRNKLYFMFRIYDVNNDGLVDLEDLMAILKMMVGTHVDEARIRRVAERTLRDADKDCDGFIDFEEFCVAFTRKDIEESMKVKFSNPSSLKRKTSCY